MMFIRKKKKVAILNCWSRHGWVKMVITINLGSVIDDVKILCSHYHPKKRITSRQYSAAGLLQDTQSIIRWSNMDSVYPNPISVLAWQFKLIVKTCHHQVRVAQIAYTSSNNGVQAKMLSGMRPMSQLLAMVLPGHIHGADMWKKNSNTGTNKGDSGNRFTHCKQKVWPPTKLTVYAWMSVMVRLCSWHLYTFTLAHSFI